MQPECGQGPVMGCCSMKSPAWLVPLHLLLWHLLTAAASLQIITTFAGSAAGITGTFGDGGPATAALLQTPYGVAVSASGAVFLADPSDNRVRVVTADGVIRAVAGMGAAGYSGDFGAATAAQLNKPYAVAVNIATGVLFIADSSNHIIRRVGLDGVITTVAGRPGVLGYTGDGSNATSALLHFPYGIGVNSFTGDLLIADSYNNAVRTVSSVTGIISAVAGTGAVGHSGDGGPAVRATLSYPTSVVANVDTGTIYVADTNNNCVRQVFANGIIANFAGNGIGVYLGDGGQASDASLHQPWGLAIDAAGNVFTSASSVIRQIDLAGSISTVAGNGSRGFSGDGGNALSAEFSFLYDIAVDANGTLYVADPFNAVIRRVKYAPSPPPVPPNHPLSPPLPPPMPTATSGPIFLSPHLPPVVLAPNAMTPPGTMPVAPHRKAIHGAPIGGAVAGVFGVAAVLALALWWRRLHGSRAGRRNETGSMDHLKASPSTLNGACSAGEYSSAGVWPHNPSCLPQDTSQGQATVLVLQGLRGEGCDAHLGHLQGHADSSPPTLPHLDSASQLSSWGVSLNARVGVSAILNPTHVQPNWRPPSPTTPSPPSTWGDTAGAHVGVAAVPLGALQIQAMQVARKASQPPAAPASSANFLPSASLQAAGVSGAPLQTGGSSSLSTCAASQGSSLGPGVLRLPSAALGLLDRTQSNEPNAFATLEPGTASAKLQARLTNVAGRPTCGGAAVAVAAAAPPPASTLSNKKMNVDGIQWTQGKLVDRGGSGRVYVGHDLNGALIAIKVQPLPTSADALRLELLLGEISTLQRLQHKNVVEYLGSAMDDKSLYICMTYEPQSLAMVLKDGLEEVVVRKYTKQILQGLEYIHSQGITHRDIKAANLLVDRDGVIKLTDFGSAKMQRHGEHDSTIQIHTIAGTPHWMSPEICLAAMGQGRGYSGTKADVWSLGVTVVEMMMGGHPWCKMDGLKAIWMVVHGEDGLPRPAHASPMAVDFMDRCMQRDPTQRATVAQLLLHPFVALQDEAQVGIMRRPSLHPLASPISADSITIALPRREALRTVFKARAGPSRLSSPTESKLPCIGSVSHMAVKETALEEGTATRNTQAEARTSP